MSGGNNGGSQTTEEWGFMFVIMNSDKKDVGKRTEYTSIAETTYTLPFKKSDTANLPEKDKYIKYSTQTAYTTDGYVETLIELYVTGAVTNLGEFKGDDG